MLELNQEEAAQNIRQYRGVQDVEPGWTENFFSGAPRVLMQGMAEVGRAVALAPSVFAIAADKRRGNTVLSDRYFKFVDETFQSAVDYWTPKPTEVGVAAQVAGKLGAMIPLILAGPGGQMTAVGATQMNAAVDLVRKHPDVTATEANLVGAVQGAGLGLGIMMPMFGQNIWQRVLIGGAGFNVTQGIVTRALSSEILGEKEAAKEFVAFGGKELFLDLLLGMAFGTAAELSPASRTAGAAAWQRMNAWAKTLKPTEIDSLLVLREAQHLNADSLPGRPVTEQDIAVHVDRMRQAIDQLARDEPVNVQDIKVSRETMPQEIGAPAEAGRPAAPVVDQAIGLVGREDFDAAVAAHVEPMGRLTPEQVAAERDVVAQRIVEDQAPLVRDPQYEIDTARLAEAERQIAHMQAVGERIRVEEGIPRVEPQAVRPPSDITPLEPEAQARAVGQHIERKLIETGMQRDEAVANAAIWEAFAKSAHERYGIPPSELMAKYGVDVRRMDSADMLLGALEQRYTQTDTPEFKRWFGESKVVDDKGKPLVVYHGTPDATFDVFKDESFFSPNPEMAGRYTHPSASSIASAAKAGDARAVYPVFLNIRQPFDTRIPAVRRIFDSEFFGKYGNGTPVGSKGLPDWTDARDIAEWVNETGQKFDGIIVDEGGFPNDAGGVTDRGISYVPLRGDQVKSAIGNRGTFDPNNPNILFQSPTEPFYSELARQVDYLKTAAAPAKGWKDQIKGLVAKGVVKQTEVEATGLNEWLDLQDGRVTKQQVLDFLKQRFVLGSTAYIDATKPDSIGKLVEDFGGGELFSDSPLSVVQAAMLPMLKHDQIRMAVVESLPVDVVNILAVHNIAPDQIVSNPNVVVQTLPVDFRAAVASGLGDALEQVRARLGTALDTGLPTGRDFELLPTLRASDLNPREIVRLLSTFSVTDAGSDGGRLAGADLAAKSTGQPAALDVAGVSDERSPADLAIALNRHDFIRNGSSGNPSKMFAASQGGARGAVNFDTGRTLISLFEKADKSTFQHETAHVFLEMTKDFAARGDAPIAAMQDWATLANWLKIEGGAIPREAHEQFARGWEKYLTEGVAPNNALKGAFKRFRDWLIDIYKSLVNIDSPLNNQVRGVMARMLDSQAKDPVSKGGLEDSRLENPEFRAALEVMGREAGWDEIGGSIIRERAGWEAEGEPNRGDVVGRTEWKPRAEWYARMQASAANMPGVGGASVRRAVQKALMGEPMNAAEKRAVTFMLDEHVQVMRQWDEMHAAEIHPEADPFEFNNAQHAAGVEPTRQNTLDMVLIDRARELDAAAVENIPDNFDDAQYMAAVREIIDAKRPNQTIDQGRADDAQAARAGDQEGQPEAGGQTESVAPRAPSDSAGYPPPPGGTGEASGAAAPHLMLENEALRMVMENEDLQIVVGQNSDGSPIYKSYTQLLADELIEASNIRDQIPLIAVAAECLMGVV